jgi:hypothetical protein
MYQSEKNYNPLTYAPHEDSYSIKGPVDSLSDIKQEDTAPQGIAWISKKQEED